MIVLVFRCGSALIGEDGSGRIKASRGEFKNRVNLLARNIELFDDFLNARAGFEVFEDGGYRHPGITKYPRSRSICPARFSRLGISTNRCLP